jgi:hypothetical protein
MKEIEIRLNLSGMTQKANFFDGFFSLKELGLGTLMKSEIRI